MTENSNIFSSNKREHYNKRLKEKGIQLSQTQIIPRTANAEQYPLSFAQQRLWFLDQMDPDSPLYNIHMAFRLGGTLNLSSLHKSLDAIVARHETLRTTFTSVGGTPFQIISEGRSIEPAVLDLRERSKRNQETEVQRIIQEETLRPFNLSQDLMLRATLLRLAPKEHILILVMHHIASDGWSMGILFRELSVLYEAFTTGKLSPLPELPIQYTDFSQWQRQWLQGDVLEKQLPYWKEKLGSAPPSINLPMDYPRPEIQTYSGGRQSITLSKSLAEELRALSLQEGVTLFMTLLTTFKVLLHRHTGQEDIVVGSPIAGRNRSEIMGLIGFFVNTMVLRTDLSGNPSFRELLSRVREVALEAYEHQDLPFEKLVEYLQPERDLSRTPLFQVFFNMLNIPDIRVELTGMTLERLHIPEVLAKFDFTLYVKEHNEGINFDLVYNTDLFRPSRIIEMLAQLRHLLSQIVKNPNDKIDHFSLVTPMSNGLLPNPAKPLSHYPGQSVHAQFLDQARRVPECPAVIDNQDLWTYRELDLRSNQLANYLISSGIKPREIIAIYGHRSASLVWALLGILKAGAAFLILDNAYPVSRLIDYLKIANPTGLLRIEAAGLLPDELHENLKDLRCYLVLPRRSTSEATSLLMDFSADDPMVDVNADDLAYVTFTSGSNGMPKGVLGTHRPISHFIQWHIQTFYLTETDRFSMLSGLSHDPLLRDIFTPLSLGATLCIPNPEDIASGLLAQWMGQEEISIAHMTPAMGQILTNTSNLITLKSLRYAFFGGDELTRGDLAKLRKIASSVTCVNFYGTTETPQATGYFIVPTQYYIIHDDSSDGMHLRETIPLGRGISNVQLLVLNSSNQLAGVSELGEIYIRTPYLAQGYLGDEALTRNRFILNPFTQTTGDRLYRTGDLGRYSSEGMIEFLGRIDNQVKVRGFRIELGEIEAVLRDHPVVRDVVVVAIEDEPRKKVLVAYIVSQEEEQFITNELRRFLKEKLPEYMLPSAYVKMDTFPLTPNGKIDRSALPPPDHSRPELDGDFVEPRTPTEQTLAEIWAKFLDIEKAGVFDNFFDLGGHSLLSIQVIARIEEKLGVHLNPRDLIFQTLGQIASLCDEKIHAQ